MARTMDHSFRVNPLGSYRGRAAPGGRDPPASGMPSPRDRPAVRSTNNFDPAKYTLIIFVGSTDQLNRIPRPPRIERGGGEARGERRGAGAACAMMGAYVSRPPSPPSPTDLSEPIREELWGVERLEQHGESLAAAHRVRPGRARDRGRLTARVRDNGRALLRSYRTIAEAIREERAITPASEWLVDNFHLVEEQLREILEDLPTGFYRQLPKLAGGPLAGYPRVYALAFDFVAHTDSRFDEEALRRYLRAYQRLQALTIGELWAVAISLRVVLVENLRRLADRMVRARASREQAKRLAERLLAEPAETQAALRP